MNLSWYNFNSYCKILIIFFPLTIILGQSFVSLFYILSFIGFVIILKKTNLTEFYKNFKYILYFFLYLILSSLFINQINIINQAVSFLESGGFLIIEDVYNYPGLEKEYLKGIF